MDILKTFFSKNRGKLIALVNRGNVITQENTTISIKNIVSGQTFSSIPFMIQVSDNLYTIVEADISSIKSNGYFCSPCGNMCVDGFNGLFEVSITSGTRTYSSMFYDPIEFYEYKARMVSLSTDYHNTVKLARKLNAFSFLENMLIDSISMGRKSDAIRFYNKMVSLFKFGYNNVTNDRGYLHVNMMN